MRPGYRVDFTKGHTKVGAYLYGPNASFRAMRGLRSMLIEPQVVLLCHPAASTPIIVGGELPPHQR